MLKRGDNEVETSKENKINFAHNKERSLWNSLNKKVKYDVPNLHVK